MSESQAKLQKIRLLLERLEQEIKGCRAMLRGERQHE